MDGLRRRWDGLAARIGILDDGLFDELVARYGEPHRRYHTVEHLAAVVEGVEGAGGSDAAVLAAWFHDAVYDPRAAPGANERASADLAVSTLRARGAPTGLVERVAALVLATVDHAPPSDPALADDAAVLVAADLAVLGAPPDEYDRYAAAIREEYGFVPDGAYRAGRAQVLRALLEGSTLPPGASENLARELRGLDGSPPG
ncbi:MAG TPA: hypothetical protein VM933_07390 [Acidimicrobiales bacterium]|nr:hypothetical protein [Acidimicrobiales bacterium]